MTPCQNKVATYLLKTNVPKFMQWKESLGQSISLGKREGWKSETQMLEQLGERELQMHIASGRIEYREGPWTEGVYNYRDKGDLVKRTRVTKNKGQEKQLPGETKGLGKGGEGRKGTGRKGLLAIMDKECADEEKPTEEEEWKTFWERPKEQRTTWLLPKQTCWMP